MTALTLSRIGGVFFAALVLAAQTGADATYEAAAKAFREGRAADAETMLSVLLKNHPTVALYLILMGEILDSGQRYGEAEPYYKRALELAPRSAALLNNLGNHYLAAGHQALAERYYRNAVALDAHHINANLHLAEMRVADKRGAEALSHLDRLPHSGQAEPVARLLRGQALALSGRCNEAASILAPLEERTGSDLSFSFSIGLVYAGCKRYESAERSFSRALHADPQNFDVLYNLGLVARNAGHLDRAREVFAIALKRRPDEPDALYALSEVLAKTGDRMMAAALLYRLNRLEPSRADVLLLLAHCTEELGYFEETAKSYSRYLSLRPQDSVARREWGFALLRAGNAGEALPELRSYALSHAKDPTGQYELAVAEAYTDHQKAIGRLDHALTLDPAMYQARYARAVLNFQEDKLPEALADFQVLVKRDSRNALLLDWMGRIALLRDRAAEAAGFFKSALDLAPRDRAMLIHYSMALRALGRKEELATVLAALARSTANQDRQPRRGLFEYLDLTPEERRARSFDALRAAAAVNPDDPGLKTRWADALMEQGRTEESVTVFREILALAPDATVLAQCGRFLLGHRQYTLAAEFLKSVPGSHLDLAIAVVHSMSPEAGLSELDKIPPVERRGDYYLLRAQVLDSLARPEEAADSLNRGIRAAPARADLYFQAAVFLIKYGRRDEAVKLLGDAERLVPDASQLMLARAITLELLRRTGEALKLLTRIQSRWPEWDRPYLIQGIIFETTLKPAKAKEMLDTAIALGAHEADAYYYLALATTEATPEKRDDALRSILQAVAMSPEDFNIQLLAGKILLDAGRYAAAVEHLTAAVRLEPKSTKAHYLLVSAYRESGDEEKSAEEAKLVERISANPEPERPSSIEHLLFAVRPSGWD